MIIAFNITAFTVILQPDWLITNSLTTKIVAWILTISAWSVAYVNRDKCVTLSWQDLELDHRREECFIGDGYKSLGSRSRFPMPGKPRIKNARPSSWQGILLFHGGKLRRTGHWLYLW